MIGTVKRMWRAAPWATAGLGLAIAVALFFAVRTALFWAYWADPAHRDEVIAGWMSPRYVATSWHVPPEVVGDALGLDQEKPRRVTLDQLAQERGVSVTELAAQLETAITAFRDSKSDRKK